MYKSILRQFIPVASQLVPTSLVQRLAGNFVPIFMLHRLEHPDYGIRGQKEDTLRQHLEYIRKHGYQPLSLHQLGQHLRNGSEIPYKSAIFTIDDGFIDHHDIAGPLFAEYDIPLTYFLITGMIDGDLWPWDDQLQYIIERCAPGSHEITLANGSQQINITDDNRASVLADIREKFKKSDNTNTYDLIGGLYEQLHIEKPSSAPLHHTAMSWKNANKLTEMGHGVAAHTVSHRILSQLSDVDAKQEIESSINRLRQMVTTPSATFAYPTGRPGDFTNRESDVLENCDILATVTTSAEPCILTKNPDSRFSQLLPRFSMPDSLTDFIQYLTWIEYAKFRILG